MVRLIQILILLDTIVREILRRFAILLILLYPFIVGCGDGAAAALREREHVNALQKQVAEASNGLVTADAEARKGWVQAQQSFEQTRQSIVQQQADVQSGLNRLEAERKSIAAARVTDLLLAGSIESIGIVLACLVPLLLQGWLMLRVWQTDSPPEVDATLVPMTGVSHPQSKPSPAEIWHKRIPVKLASDQYLPALAADD